MTATLQVEERNRLTKSERKQLRDKGYIPGSVYGKSVGSASVAVSKKQLAELFKQSAHGVIQLSLPTGGTQPVMIQDIQRHPLSGEYLHIDFHQISMDQPVKSMVPVELTGEPKGVKEGGILQVQAHEVEVKCLPDKLPSALSIDVSNLEVGESVLVSGIQLPEGVELLTDENDVLASILAPQKNDEAEEAAEADEPKAEEEATE
ncbi:50S ribosomal protein L25 [Paenibacillus sp. J31TS4]|uniref:50S ribosomal protein L25 n=1 Tax=Paenibacillus sp. J31TS4 TaxID=2807195 RepID=UPI001B1623F4|nr:50S ribosomal protein L25 [Paenibacillus sp. J31TS4]GIP41357.1 50S ribosomal protein L25 [Paenibacillus sp. J31TS4]